MALISRITSSILFLVVLSSFAGADSTKSCEADEFWWENGGKSCCLPWSPPSSPPSPPHGDQCPKSGDDCSWYYHPKNDCCVPTVPTPPPPQCPDSCYLDESSNKCHPHSQPSGYFSRRAELKSRAVTPCPAGLDACPIPGLTGSDYECVNTKTDLDSCGGCASTGQGQDCGAIEGAWNFGCEEGTCLIYTCAAGYERAYDGKSCIAQ